MIRNLIVSICVKMRNVRFSFLLAPLCSLLALFAMTGVVSAASAVGPLDPPVIYCVGLAASNVHVSNHTTASVTLTMRNNCGHTINYAVIEGTIIATCNGLVGVSHHSYLGVSLAPGASRSTTPTFNTNCIVVRNGVPTRPPYSARGLFQVDSQETLNGRVTPVSSNGVQFVFNYPWG